MKVTNSRGRVLLRVLKGVRFDTGLPTEYVLYDYTGDGCGGRTSLAGLQATITGIKADVKSAKIVGELPAIEAFVPTYTWVDGRPVKIEAEAKLTKLALKRDPSVPIGQTSPLHVDCRCGTAVPIVTARQTCGGCGQSYDNGGWLVATETA